MIRRTCETNDGLGVARVVLAALLAVGHLSCAAGEAGREAHPPDPQHDTGGAAGTDTGHPDRDTGDTSVQDADRHALSCACEEQEDCAACFRRVATCCYADPAPMLAQLENLAASCRSNRGCASCCNECAAASCAQLKRFNGCPMPPPP